MTIATQLFRIGQSVRILPGLYQPQTGKDVYTIVRCNEPDSSNPSYVIENAVNRSQRRELQSRLLPVTSDEDSAASVFTTREPNAKR